MDEEYEVVYTATNYWDGPRAGIANYKGVPHIYESVFDEAADEWSDKFLLSPLDEETFNLALEDWERWKRWRKAWEKGKAPDGSYSVLPEDRARYEEIKPVLEERCKINPEVAVRVKASFKGSTSSEPGTVKWVEIPE